MEATLVHTTGCVNSEPAMYGNRLETAGVISLCLATADGQLNAKSPRLAKRDLSKSFVQDSALGAKVSAKHRSPIFVSFNTSPTQPIASV